MSPDEQAELWLREHATYIRNVAYRRAGESRADEAVQEASIEVLRVFRDGRAHHTGYLKGVVLKRILGFVTGRTATSSEEHGRYEATLGRTHDLITGLQVGYNDPAVADETANVLDWVDIESMITKADLKPAEQEQVRLRAAGFTTKEIAAERGRSVSAVNAQWARVRTRLKEFLDNPRQDDTAPVRGVSLVKARRGLTNVAKWRVQAYLDGKHVWGGHFPIDQLAEANARATELYGVAA